MTGEIGSTMLTVDNWERNSLVTTLKWKYARYQTLTTPVSYTHLFYVKNFEIHQSLHFVYCAHKAMISQTYYRYWTKLAPLFHKPVALWNIHYVKGIHTEMKSWWKVCSISYKVLIMITDMLNLTWMSCEPSITS